MWSFLGHQIDAIKYLTDVNLILKSNRHRTVPLEYFLCGFSIEFVTDPRTTFLWFSCQKIVVHLNTRFLCKTDFYLCQWTQVLVQHKCESFYFEESDILFFKFSAPLPWSPQSYILDISETTHSALKSCAHLATVQIRIWQVARCTTLLLWTLNFGHKLSCCDATSGLEIHFCENRCRSLCFKVHFLS